MASSSEAPSPSSSEIKESLADDDPQADIRCRLRKILESTEEGNQQDLERAKLDFIALRRVMVFIGIGPPKSNRFGETTFRGQLWKLLLGVIHADVGSKLKNDPMAEYMSYIKAGKSTIKTQDGRSSYQAIRDDSFRTLKGAKLFDITKEEPKVIRVLNSYVHKSGKPYNQGMNTILAPFLVCMNEMDAFHCFHHFLEKETPTYWMSYKRQGIGTSKGFYLGARAATRLADKILLEVDPELRESIMNCDMIQRNARMMPDQGEAQIFHSLYSFRHMQVFSLVAKPLKEVIQLWDLFFALGFHMHIVAYVAQLILIRHKLMDENASINRILSQEGWPRLNAEAVCGVTTKIIQILSEDLMDELKAHTTDKELCLRLIEWDPIECELEIKTEPRRRAKSESPVRSAGSSRRGSPKDARMDMRNSTPNISGACVSQ